LSLGGRGPCSCRRGVVGVVRPDDDGGSIPCCAPRWCSVSAAAWAWPWWRNGERESGREWEWFNMSGKGGDGREWWGCGGRACELREAKIRRQREMGWEGGQVNEHRTCGFLRCFLRRGRALGALVFGCARGARTAAAALWLSGLGSPPPPRGRSAGAPFFFIPRTTPEMVARDATRGTAENSSTRLLARFHRERRGGWRQSFSSQRPFGSVQFCSTFHVFCGWRCSVYLHFALLPHFCEVALHTSDWCLLLA
jgi:hypothetical protein